MMTENLSPSPQTSASRPGANEASLASVWRILWGRRWLIGMVALEVLVVVAVVTFLRTPLYESSARLQIERATPKLTEGDDVVPMLWNEFEIQRFYQTQYLLLKDPAVIRAALESNDVRRSIQETLVPLDERTEETKLPSDDALVGAIREALKIEQLNYSNVVRLAYRHPDPKVAANVVNAVVDAYRDFFVNAGLESRKGAHNFLNEQVAQAQAEVKDLERQLAEMRGSIDAVIPASGAEMGKSRLESLDASLTQAKTERAQAEALLAAYERTKPASIEEVRSNPQVMTYQTNLAGLQRELAELEGRVGPDWPRLRELRSAIADTEATLERERERIYRGAVLIARTALDRSQREVARLESLLRSELRATADQQKGAIDFERRRSEFNQKKAALDALLTRQQDVALSANLDSILKQQVAVIDRASVAVRPAVPNVRLNLMLGVAIGLFLGLAAAFVAEALDNKVRTAAQIQELTGLPLLGAIPNVASREKPRLVFSRGKSKKGSKGPSPVMAAQQHDAEEAFRSLRGALLMAKAGGPAHTLMVTSALPGEGKSTISANICRTFAMFGQKTVLIDADLRHPRLHRVFRASNSVGLTSYLVGQAQLDEVLCETRFPGLTLIPGGPCPPDPATLLDPQRILELSRRLRQEYGFEFVLIDTPPTLVFADALSLVSAVEGVVLVGRALVTPKEAIRQSVEAARKLKAPLLGVVLNGELGDDHSGSYYRYYHYRYGYYEKRARAQAELAQQQAEAREAAHSDRDAAGGAS
jgi:capsular exopolysaccharide synthesis family protein